MDPQTLHNGGRCHRSKRGLDACSRAHDWLRARLKYLDTAWLARIPCGIVKHASRYAGYTITHRSFAAGSFVRCAMAVCRVRPASGYMESTKQILYNDFIIKAMAQRNRIGGK
jgi:hypothetical protein